MWTLIESIPETIRWLYRWLTDLPWPSILGAVLGVFGLGAFTVSNRIGNLQSAEMLTIQTPNNEVKNMQGVASARNSMMKLLRQ